MTLEPGFRIFLRAGHGGVGALGAFWLAVLLVSACVSSRGRAAPKVDLSAAREAVEKARAAGAPERARETFIKAQGHLNEAEALLGPAPGADAAERARQAETLGRIAAIEAHCAVEIARVNDMPVQPRPVATPSPEAEKLVARLKKAEEDQRRLEDRVALMQRDLEMTETEVIRTKARLKGNETKAEASSAIAEARILMRRLPDDRGRGGALTRCTELVTRAEELLRQENFGAAAFFALKAQETVMKARDAAVVVVREGVERPATQKAYTVKAAVANLRKGPATDTPVVATMPKGSALEASVVRGEWIKVKLGNVVGWVHRSLVE